MKLDIKIYAFYTFLLFSLSNMNAQSWTELPEQPEELGDINWMRNYEEAISKGKLENKNVFILFQEIPGCITCRNYGNDLLTHPLIVEAIETYFIPLAIYNNKRGDDAVILRKFNEPSWNNPVARIINPNSEKDIVQRLNGKYDIASLVSTIERGILASGAEIPAYVDLLSDELQGNDIRETHLSMYCFWSGELEMANTKGVISSQAGWMHGREVVKVKYNADIISPEELFRKSNQRKVADAVYSDDKRDEKAAKKLKIHFKEKGTFKSDKEPKYYIYKSDYRFVPMIAYQALKVNALLGKGQSPDELLSPRQLIILEKSKKSSGLPPVIDQDMYLSWVRVIDKLY